MITAVALFCAMLFASASQYPGGTSLHPSSTGFDPVENFICDLASPRAENGQVHAGFAWALGAFAAAALALVAFFFLVATMATTRPRGVLRTLGVTCAVALSLVPISSALDWAALHPFAVLGSGAAGVAGAVLAVVVLRRRFRRLAIFGAFALVVATLNFLYYAVVAWGELAYGWELPGVQKLSTVLVVAWMVAVAHASASADA